MSNVHTTTALNTNQATRPVCPFCGAEKVQIPDFKTNRLVWVCWTRQGSIDDVCVEAGR